MRRTWLSETFHSEKNPAFLDLTEIQTRLGNYYDAYQEMVECIEKFGKQAGFAFDESEEYKRWQRLDREFLKELRKLIADPRYAQLKNAVNRIGWKEALRRE